MAQSQIGVSGVDQAVKMNNEIYRYPVILGSADNNSAIAINDSVTLNASSRAGQGADGSEIFGFVTWVDDQTTTSEGVTTPNTVGVLVHGVAVSVPYNTDSAPSVNDRVVCDGVGSVKIAPAVASNGTFAAGEMRTNAQVIDKSTATTTVTVLIK